MHKFLINASIQLLPLAQDKHPYEWVDDAIAIIQQSGIKYEVGPFTTVLEGTYEEVMSVVMNFYIPRVVPNGLQMYKYRFEPMKT